MGEIAEKHVASQARNGASLTASVLGQTLLKRRPADRSLSSAFYEHHEFGSRDRRLISETLFAVLRWWGWLRHLMPRPFVEAWEHRDESARLQLTLEEFYPAFAAAWFLEGRNELPAAAQYWLDGCGIARGDIHFLPPEAPLLERKRYLLPFLRHARREMTLRDEELLPDWCLEELTLPDGHPVTELLEWEQARPPVWLRVQTADARVLYRELAEHEVRAARHPRMANAWQLEYAGANLRGLPAFRAGQFEIQDIASQIVAEVCAPKPGERWWDACAGGGGKTLHLASLMKQKGTVLATDIRLHKLEDLKLRARRAQFPNIRYKEWKGKDMPTFHDQFHGVLVDTACSCSGTWRRNPDARWTTFPEEIDDFHRLQLQLLTNASRGVRPGGRLVYSTCSMFQRENQAVVQEFLEAHPDFALEPFVCPMTGRETDGMSQVWPWDADCDAMFTARMTRKP